jgi:hypothetical protein
VEAGRMPVSRFSLNKLSSRFDLEAELTTVDAL